MTAHHDYYRELARQADRKASTARDASSREFWHDRASQHRVWAEHYDSRDAATKLAWDLAAVDGLRALRGEKIPSNVKCMCDETGCRVTRLGGAPAPRTDSADPEQTQRERDRARSAALLAERDARLAAASGAGASAPRAGYLVANGVRSIANAAQSGSPARQEMIKARKSACKVK